MAQNELCNGLKNVIFFFHSCVFLPNNGAFFVNYLVTSALIGTALELCRFPELVSYAGNMACARNEGEKRLIRKVREHEDSDIRTESVSQLI